MSPEMIERRAEALTVRGNPMTNLKTPTTMLSNKLQRTAAEIKKLGRVAMASTMIAALSLPMVAQAAVAKTVTKEEVNIKAPRVRVIDYPSGFKKDTPKRLKKAGVKIVIRYVGFQKGKSSWKNLRKWEVDELRKNDIDIATVYETSASWMRGGYSAGVKAAKLAKADIKAVGGPDKPFVYFACDEDAKYYDKVNATLRGAAHVLGGDKVGIYGGYDVVKNAIESKSAAKAWQTVGWSKHRVYKNLAIFQTVKLYDGNLGIDYDSNFAKKDDIGQWGRKTVTVNDDKQTPTNTTKPVAPKLELTNFRVSALTTLFAGTSS
jgi:hypothetical protein